MTVRAAENQTKKTSSSSNTSSSSSGNDSNSGTTPDSTVPDTSSATPAPSVPAEFSDVRDSDWYYSAAQYVQGRNLMDGVGGGHFAGERNLSRAQLAQILYNLSGKAASSGSTSFTDVPAGEWYFSAVSWAAQNGIVSGYSNGTFGPNDGITREQLAVMLWRYAGQPASSGTLNFSDASQASDYALQALRWAVENGILSGNSNGNLNPGGFATRAEVASIIMRFCENVSK